MAEEKKYQWQGEPVKVQFGHCYVHEDKEKKLCWYNYECNLDFPYGTACIPAIRVITKNDGSFCIANHFGIGVNKLEKGGYPDQTHFSLPMDTWEQDRRLKETEFDLDGYEEHEKRRDKWQIEQFPDNYKRLKELQNSLQNRRW